jgi:hypothetical protein
LLNFDKLQFPDLRNEVRGIKDENGTLTPALWGTGNEKLDWNLAAEEAGKRVQGGKLYKNEHKTVQYMRYSIGVVLVLVLVSVLVCITLGFGIGLCIGIGFGNGNGFAIGFCFGFSFGIGISISIGIGIIICIGYRSFYRDLYRYRCSDIHSGFDK